MASSARTMGVTVTMGACTTLASGSLLWLCTLTFFTKFAWWWWGRSASVWLWPRYSLCRCWLQSDPRALKEISSPSIDGATATNKPRGTGRKRQVPDAVGCSQANVVNNVDQNVLSDQAIFGCGTFNLT